MSWSSLPLSLGPVLDAGVGLEAVCCLECLVTISTHVSWPRHVSLHVFLHVLLGSVFVATVMANKLSVLSPLKHPVY